MSKLLAAALLVAAVPFAVGAAADTIHVGVTISTTGPAASLGIPQQKSIALLPHEVAGQTIVYDVLDDGADSTRAVANMRKLVDENHADVVIGSSTTPASLALIPVAAETQVPLISLAASAALIEPMEGPKTWVFKVPQNDSLMADAIAAHMAAHGIGTVGFIAFNDAYGDGWAKEFGRASEAKGIRILASERFARTDTSVTGQVLKVMAAKPDAVLVAGAGTPAALPQKALHERGYGGAYYQTHGIANNDFLRVGGKDVEGTILPVGPMLVAEQLPDTSPIKAHALDYIHAYEAANGAGSVATFGGHAYDAATLLQAAIPEALRAGKPGTAAFRSGLRAAMERQKDLVMCHGVATMSATDHNGFDTRARVMVTIKDGAWKLLP